MIRLTAIKIPPADKLALLLKDAGVHFIREVQFAKELKRRWRADFLCYVNKTNICCLVEVEGAVFTNGRHTRGAGYTKDIEKYNTAALLGFLVVRCTPAHVESGQALTWIKQALAVRGAKS